MDDNEKLLQEVYKNVKMGQDSIIDLLDKASDNSFRGEMTAQLESYRRYAGEATEKLGERGLKPKEITPAAKAGSKIGITLNTMLDTTTSHLAEMMINGATMGIVDLEKQLNDGVCSAEARSFAEDVLRFEKGTVEKLGRFL